MPQTMCTLRFETRKLNHKKWGATERVIYESKVAYFPSGSVKISHPAAGFTDFDMPLWLAKSKEFEEYVISEYPED